MAVPVLAAKEADKRSYSSKHSEASITAGLASIFMIRRHEVPQHEETHGSKIITLGMSVICASAGTASEPLTAGGGVPSADTYLRSTMLST